MTPSPLKKVLIVEDDLDIQAVARIALETVGGFTVETCGSGKEALEVTPRSQPDIIPLDVMMPDMDAPTTLPRLPADPAVSAHAVAFFPANAMPTDLAYYRHLGAAGFISQPLHPMDLADPAR